MTERVSIGRSYREGSTVGLERCPRDSGTGCFGRCSMWRGWKEPGGNIRNMAPERRTEPVVPVRLRQVPPVIAAGYAVPVEVRFREGRIKGSGNTALRVRLLEERRDGSFFMHTGTQVNFVGRSRRMPDAGQEKRFPLPGRRILLRTCVKNRN